MARRTAASWTHAILISCLLRSIAGFVGTARPWRTESGVKFSTTAAANSRHRPSAAGVEALRAAFEVELGRKLEMGSVLVAGADNYGHMTFKAVALVYEHGEGILTRAVCIDKGLDFTVGEMTTGDIGPFTDNRLFRGGEDGGEAAIMIHTHDIQGARPLGDTGLFVGGFLSALDLVEKGGANPGDFKFFFNYLAWPAGALEEQVKKGLWKVVRLPNDVVLETKRMRDMELWGRIEFALKKRVEQ